MQPESEVPRARRGRELVGICGTPSSGEVVRATDFEWRSADVRAFAADVLDTTESPHSSAPHALRPAALETALAHLRPH